MSVALVVLLTVVTLPPSAHRDDVVVYEASELVDYCRVEAEAYFVGQGYAIYQWAASHKSNGNTLLVNGRLHVGHEDVEVKCRVPRGARLTYMTLEVAEPTQAPDLRGR